MILKNKNHYRFKDFSGRDAAFVFSRRAAGNMSLVYGDTKNSLPNRKKFLSELDIDYQDLVCAQQIHGNQTRYIQETDKGKGALAYDTALADTDALITEQRQLPLAVFTADCLSIFLYDPHPPAIGLIHAGWRGSGENIIAKTIQLMQENFATKRENLQIGFGPCIRSCCYQVGEEFKDLFTDGLIQRDGDYYLDLIGINKKRLLGLGVKDKNIFDCGEICTSCQNSDFFSLRKEGKTCSRNIAVAILK